MAYRADPKLIQTIGHNSSRDVSTCFNCGNCTAVCQLSEGKTVFPRNIIRYVQLGLKDKVHESLEPWLCYYCGECSTTCPRQANPGETMMDMRRWLISEYDWTGLSKKLYTSKAWEIGLPVVLGLFVVMLFVLFSGPMVADHVEINTFMPVEYVEIGDLVMAGLLAFFLLTNVARMFRFIMRGSGNVPLSLYITEFKTAVIHLFTQMRWRKCETPTNWLKHLFLVTAYGTMFLLVVVFIKWFQTDEIRSFWHPTRLLGYYATVVLLYVTGNALISRMRKSQELHKHSHLSDWMFLILLFLTTLTGILFHYFRIANFPYPAYYTYVIHLAIAVPMLVIEVPFGKWAHLAYRPIALYLLRVKERAAEMGDTT